MTQITGGNFVQWIRSSFEFIVHLYISVILRRKVVYVVVGVRRSGNHAFINWFVNALEGQHSILQLENRRLYTSISGKTVFFNEANWMGLQRFINSINKNRSILKQASFVIISLEDYLPSRCDPYIPIGANKIKISRSVLNVVSSRIRRSIDQAKLGLDRGDMRIDDSFFEKLVWAQSLNNKAWASWCYDLWLKDQDDYRLNFLKQFGLYYNETPVMSEQGGGSSFTGQLKMPNAESGCTRWMQIELPTRVIDLIEQHDNVLDLTTEEREFMKSRNNNLQGIESGLD